MQVYVYLRLRSGTIAYIKNSNQTSVRISAYIRNFIHAKIGAYLHIDYKCN